MPAPALQLSRLTSTGRVDGPGRLELGYRHPMMIRPLARWLVAPLACLLVIAPTIAGLAHERAHHAAAGDHVQPSGDRDHDHDVDHETGSPETASDHSVSGDHADSGHHAARIGSGLSSRVDFVLASATPIGELRAGIVVQSPIARGPLDRRPDQTRHPPSLPRRPPRL